MALNTSQSPWAVTYSASHSLADNRATVIEQRWLQTFARTNGREQSQAQRLALRDSPIWHLSISLCRPTGGPEFSTCKSESFEIVPHGRGNVFELKAITRKAKSGG